MVLVASETGHVYTFATQKLQPLITSEAGKALIQTCLNSPEEVINCLNPKSQTFRILEMYPISHFIKIGIDNWSSKTKGGVGGTGVNSRMTETGYEEHDLSYNVNNDESKELDDLDVEEDEYDEDSKLTVGMHESKSESIEAMLRTNFC